MYRTARDLGPGNYADVGVYRGASTATLAAGLRDGGHQGTIYAVDFFESPSLDLHASDNDQTPAQLGDLFDEKYEPKGIRLELCIGDSATIARGLTNTPFKLVFIDADHSYWGCRRDFLAWSPLVETRLPRHPPRWRAPSCPGAAPRHLAAGATRLQHHGVPACQVTGAGSYTRARSPTAGVRAGRNEA